jgi:hypothetical protein
MLAKKDADAAGDLRSVMKFLGFYDFDIPGLRGAQGKKLLSADYAQMDGSGTITATTLTISVYRTKRGDRRFNISWPSGAQVSDGEFLAFTATSLGSPLLLNLSRGLPDESESIGPTWSNFISSALALGGEFDAEPSTLIEVEVDGAKDLVTKSRYMSDAELRSAIEKHSVAAAKAFYMHEKNASEVTERGKPYDLDVTLGGEAVRVEVKGSLANVDEVFVTKNEVEEARKFLRTELVVVDKITRTKKPGADWVLSGGRLRHWDNWKPSEKSLTALQYRHVIDTAPPKTELAL